jgi:hypothetical protein
LISPEPNGCIGQASFPLEAIVTNTSNMGVEISTDGVGGGVVLSKYESNRLLEERSLIREIEPKSWVYVAPHQSIIIPFRESLNAKDPNLGKLLASHGLFSLQIQFAMFTRHADKGAQFSGSIRSNKTMFLLSDCPTPLTGIKH